MRASRDALDGDDETQRVARFDEPTGPSIAVREIGGTEEFPLVPLAHETHRLAPGEDHLTRREASGFPRRRDESNSVVSSASVPT